MSEKVLSYIEQFEQTANGEKVVKGFRWVL